ncbi:hypothetical protein [Salinimicrobium soli]|uniref:hypothetical protein n=1 Tax=Salinimicrobium soli TaxID=1254399 RepID=UPI003AAB24D9
MEKELIKAAASLGYKGSEKDLYELRDWLREKHQIHVEVGSIWDEKTNVVESYFYTVTAPIQIYYTEPEYQGGGTTHSRMLVAGVAKGLSWLETYKNQNHSPVTDDELIIAYLRGYGEKKKQTHTLEQYSANILKYAYKLGRQGDYIEEGLTDDDIVALVRNEIPEEEKLRLEN